jgi:hypothetical protein
VVDSHVLFIKQQGGLSQGKQINKENKDMNKLTGPELVVSFRMMENKDTKARE